MSLHLRINQGLPVAGISRVETLSLSGSATKEQYETALETITYNNTSDTPNTSNRTVTWIVNDGTANSTGITSTITVAVANDAPTVSGNDATLAYTENDGAVLVDSTLTLADVDSANLTGATITISSGFVSGGEDVLSFTAANGISGTFDNSTGILALSGSATKAQYETALESVKPKIHQNPNTGNRTVSWVVTDGSDSSSAVYSTITVAAADNDAPSLGGAGGTLAYTESGAAAVIDSALTLSDGDDTNMESATVEITGGFVSGEDVLSFTNANGITHTWDSTTGIVFERHLFYRKL